RTAAMFGLGSHVEKARTTGTFPYITGYTTFLTVMFCLGAGLAAKNRWRLSGNFWPFILLTVTTAAMFTTGSRAPIYGLVITAPLVLYIWWTAKLVSPRIVLQMAWACGVMAVIVQFTASGAIDAYQYRASHSNESLIGRFFDPFSR